MEEDEEGLLDSAVAAIEAGQSLEELAALLACQADLNVPLLRYLAEVAASPRFPRQLIVLRRGGKARRVDVDNGGTRAK